MNLSVKKTTNHHIFRAGMLGFFISYIAVMLCLLFWERAFNNASILYPQKEKVSYLNSIRTHIILTPMHSIKHFSEEILKYDVKTILTEFSDFHFAFYNLFGNIVFFMPMGIFIPYFFKRYQNLFRFAILMLFLAFSIESVQLLTLTGTFDIDDIILNVTGGYIGCILFLIVHKVIAIFNRGEEFDESKT